MKAKGFTIIELMIVVSIISLLAALATANYLNAQVRSKVSAVKMEMRALAAAIEVYHTDHNTYPRMVHWRYYQDDTLDKIDGIPVSGALSSVISTPVAYVTNARMMDPFMSKESLAPINERLYTYQVTDVYRTRNPKSEF